jgi:serine/threonine protein kinase
MSIKINLETDLSLRFNSMHCIGSGTYGTVFSAFDSKLNKAVALKIFRNNEIFDDKNESNTSADTNECIFVGASTSFLRELSALIALRGNNFINR